MTFPRTNLGVFWSEHFLVDRAHLDDVTIFGTRSSKICKVKYFFEAFLHILSHF